METKTNYSVRFKAASTRLARSFIRAYLRILPSRLMWLVIEEAVARFRVSGKDFLTMRLRPKSGQRPAYRPMNNIPTPGNTAPAIIIQGPLFETDDFTLETVRYYRNTLPNSPVIVSTWNDQPRDRIAELRDAGAEVVLSEKPKISGRINVNLQVISTHQGLLRARELGCSHSAKTRSDQRVFAAHILAGLPEVVQAYPVVGCERPRERIVALGRGTAKYCPQFLSDQFMFGRTDDLLEYWSPEFDSSTFTIADYLETAGTSNDLEAIVEWTPEYYLLQQYLKRIDEKSEFTLKYWWRLLAERFFVIDAAMLDLYWPKYQPNTEVPELTHEGHVTGTVIRFIEWLRLYHLMNSTTDVPEISALGAPQDLLPEFLSTHSAPLSAAPTRANP